jgi:hypothetical protein
MVSAFGPMKVMPASSQASTNRAFRQKAVARVDRVGAAALATRMISSIDR